MLSMGTGLAESVLESTTMNYSDRQGIPLRADRTEAARSERRSWSRAIAAQVLAPIHGTSPEQLLRATWPNDTKASVVLRAAVSPTSTGDFPAQDVISAFRSLAPGAAAWKLFAHPSAMQLSLDGVHQINIPNLATLPKAPIFVAEGAPAPALRWSFMKTPLGPAKKILVMSGISEELEWSTPQNASQVIGQILADATNKSVDTLAFDANAGTAIRPAGLLYGVTPTTAAPASGQATLGEVIATDLSNLVGAIGTAGIDPSDTVFIAGPREASMIQKLVDAPVFMSLGVTAKSVIAVAPQGLASGYQGPPTIETSKETTVHWEDTTPLELVGTSPATVAAPSKSAFQSGLIVIKVRAECAWAAATGAVQVVNNVNW
jgi:hypothetical protein